MLRAVAGGILVACAVGVGACATGPQTPTATMVVVGASAQPEISAADGRTPIPIQQAEAALAPVSSAASTASPRAFTTTITVSPRVSTTTITESPQASATTTTVNTLGQATGEITDHFAGLSFESGTLNGGHFDADGNLPQLLRNLGSSIMRFGGNTVDRPTFQGSTQSELAGLAGLAKASGWTVLYSENLGHYNPAVVTADAKAVATALGPSLAAIGCGNEPNAYGGAGYRPSPYSMADYLRDDAACLAAVRSGAPNAPLEGADLTGAPSWLLAYAQQQAGKVALLGQHLYAAGCTGNYVGKTSLQADATLLSPAMAAHEVANFAWLVSYARVAKAQPIMSETNSICGGGLPGVSNSYAAALWAIDYMLAGAADGVRGLNFHDAFTDGCAAYSPLCPIPGQPDEFTAEPLYYGMLFTHLLGSGSLLPVTVQTDPKGSNVTAFALKPATGRGVRLIVENLTSAITTVTLTAGGAASSATALYLAAAGGLTATSGVEIQGATVAANGTINPGAPTTITCSSGGCPLTLPPYTASLVTIP